MDCKSVIEEQILEKYIADTLDKKDRKACDEHLHGCESCKGELEFQMLLLAGINDSAKDAMKNEIRQQVSTRKTHQGRFIYYSENILKIAAIIILFLALPQLYKKITEDKPGLIIKAPAKFEMQTDELSESKVEPLNLIENPEVAVDIENEYSEGSHKEDEDMSLWTVEKSKELIEGNTPKATNKGFTNDDSEKINKSYPIVRMHPSIAIESDEMSVVSEIYEDSIPEISETNNDDIVVMEFREDDSTIPNLSLKMDSLYHGTEVLDQPTIFVTDTHKDNLISDKAIRDSFWSGSITGSYLQLSIEDSYEEMKFATMTNNAKAIIFVKKYNDASKIILQLQSSNQLAMDSGSKIFPDQLAVDIFEDNKQNLIINLITDNSLEQSDFGQTSIDIQTKDIIQLIVNDNITYEIKMNEDPNTAIRK